MNGTNPENNFTLCQQRNQILDNTGHMLIVGGPGAGKTTIGLLKARRWILQQTESEQQVLFLSFSNSAIRRIIESADGILTKDVADQVNIKTYHSFAWEIIKSHGYLISSRRNLSIISAQDAAVRAAGLDDNDWYTEQNRLYDEDGLVTYDQFAPRAVEILNRSSTALDCFCTAYPLILVDEFQDTDEDQWALVKLLAKKSIIIALGDSEQRIYEWRPGVSGTRLQEFTESLDSESFDFTTENNRSPATGIAGFARSLLSPNTQPDFPDDISLLRFPPKQFKNRLHIAVRKALSKANDSKNNDRPTVAVAARSAALVRRISDALSDQAMLPNRTFNPVPHDILFNQNQVLLSARVIAHIMSTMSNPKHVQAASILRCIADVMRSKGNITGIKNSDTLAKWADKCDDDIFPKTKCVKAISSVIDKLNQNGFVGSPTHDWITIRDLLEASGTKELELIANQARYLRLLRRGSIIEQSLISLWSSQGNYKGAEIALERAILQHQLSDTHRESATVTVMNMHQLKGREYDAVVLVEDKYSTFSAKDTLPLYSETRRLLQVALTRARHHVVILTHRGENTFDLLSK
tara:strand:+ start:20756 stop:22498 length:1743 start_codon:yes stop_codon:yes gene_type:complete